MQPSHRTTHLNTAYNKILKTLAVMTRLKNTIPRSITKTLYNSLSFPNLTYSVTAWDIQTLLVLNNGQTTEKYNIQSTSSPKTS